WLAALCAACAAASAYYDAFWAMVIFALFSVWASITASNAVDSGWRLRAGMVLGVVVLGGLSLWPTISNVTKGTIPIPAYAKERIEFELVAGLDLDGGLRLVYTVDVEEAIKDRRDSRYEDMRRELAK